MNQGPNNAINILNHFTQNVFSNINEITNDDIEQTLLPITTAINDFKRTQSQNNIITFEPISSKRFYPEPKEDNFSIESEYKVKRSNFVLQKNKDGEFILSRTEGKLSTPNDKINLKNKMLNKMLNENKMNKHKPQKFQLSKEPKIAYFTMENDILDNINNNQNKFISKLSIQY